MPIDLSKVPLQDFALFHGVEDDVARRFVQMGFHFQFEAGSPLVSNNDRGDTFFLILHGLAKLVLANSKQEEISVTLFRSGEFFGELSLLEEHATRSANVVAITPIEVVTIQRKDFLKAMHQYPELALNLARVLGKRLRSMNDRMQTARLPDDVHKVAHTLLLLAQKGQTFDIEGVTVLLPPLSLKEWALFCYTSTEGLMQSLERLKSMAAVEWQHQRIVITNLEALRQCAHVHQQRLGAV